MKSNTDINISSEITDFELWRMLDHTRFMISRLRQRELDQVGLTPEQAYILDILERHGGMTTINQIAEITMRRHHSISTQITRMVKQGLVRKKVSALDHREYEISITARGRELFGQISRESITHAFSCLSTDDKKALRTRLMSLLVHAYNLNGKEYRQFVSQ